MKNRNIFPWIGTLLLGAILAVPASAQKIDIKASDSTRQIHRVQSVLEGRGVVLPADEQSMKMSVDARFNYDERIIARTNQLKSIRSYDKALAHIHLDNKPVVNELDSENRIIISQTQEAGIPVQLASLGGPISQKEYELINTPANTLILSEIFEKRSVRKGDTWQPDQEILARFLNIDTIDESDVLIELASLKGKTATLVIAGETRGTIDGANTTLTVNGNALFSISGGFVAQSSITITQQRDIGLLAPGLDATFKMITRIQPIRSSQHLTNEGLANLRKTSSRISDDLILEPEGSDVSLLHSRDWRVIADHPARTILRYNYNGRMLGQCDIIPLPKRLADQEQTLEQFKSVVKNSLAESSAEIEGADRSTTSNGLEWLRVDATGAENGVNLRWTYFTITHEDGRRVQLVFTTEPSHASAFDGLDKNLIDTIRFAESQTTPARNASFKK